ncbi:Glucan 1,3-beta-glucosidase [Mycena indigotica]|uniref:Glucan 1,3-beta-glucosidase n=1 Tax=Mycena indigotica TaxID=2126181 RepID=A0A8H6T817_9AGAR|nr:Glucan 1,3-beta-glucosidase [Mycena indigotica]KAF7311921.1 Glucan 1,3-beta-glucosidase [Mycena indigotica]
MSVSEAPGHGTNINAANCPTSSVSVAACASAFLGIHITSSGSGYFENVWVWNADHDLDDPNQSRINSFSGRGILVESARGPVWLVGTASEHHVIYQYAFHNAQNIYAGLIQTETPYFQPTPIPPAPFSTNPLYGDPSEAVVDAWGLVITRSFNMFVYGAGLYSFFQTYGQGCVTTRNCQNSMVLVDRESSAIYIYQLTTTGTTNMISYPGNVSIALQADNIDGYASTLTLWEADVTALALPATVRAAAAAESLEIGTSYLGVRHRVLLSALVATDYPDPNPIPPANAVSETFAVAGGPTTVIPIPSQPTIISVGGQIIFLEPGGTPATALLPSTLTEVNGVTPTWSFQIMPPPTGPITFTAPTSGSATFTTVVQPPGTGAVQTVTGPGGTKWSISGAPTGPVVLGTLPTSIGISGGITPTPIMPIGWLGPWTDPVFPFTVTTGQPPQLNTDIPWNPNPFPPPGAKTETFVCSGTTTSFPIPTATTTVFAGGATITLNSGGTPVGGPLVTQCSEVGGIFPTWSLDIIPPPGAATITFTGPLTSTPTYFSIVPVPPKSDSPKPTVTGPPHDHNRCNDLNIWQLLFGGFIDPCLPIDVGIINGITPVPIPPPGWKGPWTNPIPRPTPPPPGGGGDDQNTQSVSQSSASQSSSSSTACATRPADLTLPDDPNNADWDGQGTDPDRRRKRKNAGRSQAQSTQERYVTQGSPAARLAAWSKTMLSKTAEPLRLVWNWRRQAAPVTVSLPPQLTSPRLPSAITALDLSKRPANGTHQLFRRNRRVNIPRCPGVMVTNTQNVLLGAADYVVLDPANGVTGTTLIGRPVGGKPVGEVNQEHVFELGYIGQWVESAPMRAGDCNWVSHNLIDYVRTDGSTMGLAIVQAIDQGPNMVWVDKPLNQAKSNVVNQNANTAQNPPMRAAMDTIAGSASFRDASDTIYRIEFFLRNLAATGQYFAGTTQIFQDTALRVQNLLSEITPTDVLADDASLPLMFNTWLTNLINTYPAGCTSRGQNAWTYYRNAMGTLATRLGVPVPACFPLYSANVYNPSTFSARLLIPTAPTSPRCNVPGTDGVLTYTEVAPVGVSPAVGILEYGTNNNEVQIMGSGNTNRYGVGSGASRSGHHLQGRALSAFSATDCPNTFLFDDVAAGTAGYASAELAFTCGNGLGPQTVDVTFVMGGRPLPACILVRRDGTAPWKVLCSPTAQETNNCAGTFILSGAPGLRRALDPLSKAISELSFSVSGGL